MEPRFFAKEKEEKTRKKKKEKRRKKKEKDPHTSLFPLRGSLSRNLHGTPHFFVEPLSLK